MSYFSRGKGQSNPYAVGDRVYGGTRMFPNLGPSDPLGYRERDLITRARRSAALRRLQAGLGKNHMSSDYLRGSNNATN